MPDQEAEPKDPVTRRSFLGSAAAALSAGLVTTPVAMAQSRTMIQKGESNRSAQNPGPVNQAIADENPNSEIPPITDHGDVRPFWYSFDLAHRRIQDGGWTRQVTQNELPDSHELAGVNMRLTAGSYRELHWHRASEWAYMLYGNARVTVLNPDGTVFIGDVSKGDLWYFPAGYPHSIQGLGPDGAEFLLVFDQGDFSEYATFLLSGWLAHTPAEVLAKNFRLPESALQGLPTEGLYIFPGTIPGPLEDDKQAVGGQAVESKVNYTFRMTAMQPAVDTAAGDVRIVDSTIFPPSRTIASALVRVRPGAMRELHWHPNASEWQYWIAGSGRMTVFASSGRARTMDFHASDVGFVHAVAGHYIENTGTEDILFLEMFRTAKYLDISLNQWLRRVPPQLAQAELHLDTTTLDTIPDRKLLVIPK